MGPGARFFSARTPWDTDQTGPRARQQENLRALQVAMRDAGELAGEGGGRPSEQMAELAHEVRLATRRGKWLLGRDLNPRPIG